MDTYYVITFCGVDDAKFSESEADAAVQEFFKAKEENPGEPIKLIKVQTEVVMSSEN